MTAPPSTGVLGVLPGPVLHWGEFKELKESTSVLDLKEIVSKEFVNDLIEKSCIVEYTKGDPLDALGDEDVEVESYATDSEVSYSLELKKHNSALRQLISLAQTRISTPATQLQRLPDVPVPPSRPRTHLKHPVVHPLGFLPSRQTPFTLGQGPSPDELNSDTCLYILTKSISALTAHLGWDGSMKEALFVFRDAVDDFIRRLVGMLRVVVDQDALQGGSSFPDCMEQVFQTMGLGSIRDLHSYYQVQILGRIERMEGLCTRLRKEYKELSETYNMSLPSSSVWDSTIKQETISEIEEGEEADQDVPELHFPSTSDGDLTLQPSATLRTGFEMLQSLEQQQLLTEDDNTGNDMDFEEVRPEDRNPEPISEALPSLKRMRRL